MLSHFACWCVWVAVAQGGVPNYGQPSAVLWKDQLLVATNGPRASVNLSSSHLNFVYRGLFDPDRYKIRSPLEHNFLIYAPLSSRLAKLDLRDGRLLVAVAVNDPHVLPLVDLPMLETSEFAELLAKQRGYPNALHMRAQATVDFHPLLFPPHRPPDVPVPEYPLPPVAGGRLPSQVAWEREARYRWEARFDVQVAGPKAVRLFHARDGRLFVSVEPDYLAHWRRDPKKRGWADNLLDPPDRGLRTGKLPAEFTGHFAAYAVGASDYLVTGGGAVYLCAAKGKAEVEVTAVWTDPKRKIVGVVQDQKNAAVYGWGFVTTSVQPERFFVRFGPKMEAVGYKREVPLWVDRSDAFLESYECARAFRANEE
ncbi:MAG: hypothetical protein K2V38_03820 [Gemmataceae bacterium]|nr:hypothetical protein [Gemmataceae bacterium]